MATRFERLMAKIDIVIHHVFSMSSDRSGSGEGAPYNETYWSRFGRRFAIIAPDGRVKMLGYSWWTRHSYDANGNLLSRYRLVLKALPEDRVVYDQAADRAYEQQPRRKGAICIGITTS